MLPRFGSHRGIKDARMERLPAQRRPHYPPIERLAILELRAARGWSLAQSRGTVRVERAHDRVYDPLRSG